MSYYSSLEIAANAKQLVDVWFEAARDEDAIMWRFTDDGAVDSAYDHADYLSKIIFEGYNVGGTLDALKVAEGDIYAAILRRYGM